MEHIMIAKNKKTISYKLCAYHLSSIKIHFNIHQRIGISSSGNKAKDIPIALSTSFDQDPNLIIQ